MLAEVEDAEDEEGGSSKSKNGRKRKKQRKTPKGGSKGQNVTGKWMSLCIHCHYTTIIHIYYSHRSQF